MFYRQFTQIFPYKLFCRSFNGLAYNTDVRNDNTVTVLPNWKRFVQKPKRLHMIQELLYTPCTRMHPVRSSSPAESSMPKTFISSKGLINDRCIWYGYVN